jgi:large subunit ribosomal protein L6e
MSSKPQTKKFQGGERTVPHHLEKASKYYPAEEDRKPKTVSDASDERSTSG